MNHPLSKLYDPSKVTNSVRFHYLYYLSKAYFKRFIMELEAAKKVGEGYGTVVYYVRKAIETMQTVKTVSPSLSPVPKESGSRVCTKGRGGDLSDEAIRRGDREEEQPGVLRGGAYGYEDGSTASGCLELREADFNRRGVRAEVRNE